MKKNKISDRLNIYPVAKPKGKLERVLDFIGVVIGITLFIAIASALSSCNMTRREVMHQQDKLWSNYSYQYDSLQIIYNNVGNK